jgi:hypothetical protein
MCWYARNSEVRLSMSQRRHELRDRLGKRLRLIDCTQMRGVFQQRQVCLRNLRDLRGVIPPLARH